MQQDLNALYYFVQVVDAGGFAAANKALGIPKSKLSRHVAQLEDRLGVRLIQRTSRRFSVTDVGQAYYLHCKAMLLEAEAAQAVIDSARTEPSGTVRVSCPVTLLHTHVGDMLLAYAQQYPAVKLQLLAVNRPVDVLGEGFDLAIRVRPLPLEDSDLVIRVLGYANQYLVANPSLFVNNPAPRHPTELSTWPILALDHASGNHSYTLFGPQNAKVVQHYTATLTTTDMLTLKSAALKGIGIAKLPAMMVHEDLRTQTLVRVLPEWAPRQEAIHIAFPTRRGMIPAVRCLIDYLAEQFTQDWSG